MTIRGIAGKVLEYFSVHQCKRWCV